MDTTVASKAITRFLSRSMPKNKCCPITLNALGQHAPYFLLFEADQLYIFEAKALAQNCTTNGSISPITRRPLYTVELKRLARASGAYIPPVPCKTNTDVDPDLLSVLGEDAGILFSDMITHISCSRRTADFWQTQRPRIIQSIGNLSHISPVAAREVIELHIHRIELLLLRHTNWVSNHAARNCLAEMYQLRNLTITDTTHDNQDMMLRIAMHNIRLNSVRIQQNQTENELAHFITNPANVPMAVNELTQNLFSMIDESNDQQSNDQQSIDQQSNDQQSNNQESTALRMAYLFRRVTMPDGVQSSLA